MGNVRMEELVAKATQAFEQAESLYNKAVKGGSQGYYTDESFIDFQVAQIETRLNTESLSTWEEKRLVQSICQLKRSIPFARQFAAKAQQRQVLLDTVCDCGDEYIELVFKRKARFTKRD